MASQDRLPYNVGGAGTDCGAAARHVFRLSQVPAPARMFVFVDEHPDSINDGYFLNRATYREWVDLPASHHDGAAAFAFADGHSRLQKWAESTTKAPSHPDSAKLPRLIPKMQDRDFEWVTDHMSVDRVKIHDSY
jgi:hypothetical protein